VGRPIYDDTVYIFGLYHLPCHHSSRSEFLNWIATQESVIPFNKDY